jgi:hypothetical protein
VRIIFSRKGFATSSGGIPSPIFPDGTLFSLPIPHTSLTIAGQAPTTSAQIDVFGLSAAEVLGDLGGRPEVPYAHRHPDLREGAISSWLGTGGMEDMLSP